METFYFLLARDPYFLYARGISRKIDSKQEYYDDEDSSFFVDGYEDELIDQYDLEAISTSIKRIWIIHNHWYLWI